MPNGWITDPPIITYGPDDWTKCRVLARRLKRMVERWGEGSGVATEDAIAMCGMILENLHTDKFKGDEVCFVYMYAGDPVALMLLRPSHGWPYVIDIVCHPGTQSGGATMMEYALNYLKSKGKPERLKLWALNERAVGPYLGMGFESGSTRQDMTLDPKQSPDKWKTLDGRWRYTSGRNPGLLYAVHPTAL